jgi:hypothetical protein
VHHVGFIILRSSIFWEVTQRILIVRCRLFETKYKSRVQNSSSTRRTAWYIIQHIFLPWRNNPSGPKPLHYLGFIITLETHCTRWNSSGQMISPTQETLPAKHIQQTDIHGPGAIRAHNPSHRATADPRLRPHGLRHLREPVVYITSI